MRGQELGYELRRRSPKTLVIGISNNIDALPKMPDSPFSSFVSKVPLRQGHEPRALISVFEDIVSAGFERKPKCFIVHGHDETLLAELRGYLRVNLKLSDPVVLRDRPALGRTVIEAFEEEANVDIVFVLLTPDDPSTAAVEKRRSRQNVIFELGFFYAKLQRASGRIFLLKSDELDVPSDIAGVVYIDVSKGIAAADTNIRAGLDALGWL
jgi:predicted nucleotide-binding protein